MGKRGPRRTPTDTLKLRGSPLADRRNDPEVKTGAPPCPQWLSKEAKVVWKQIIPHLRTMGVLAKSDGNALARYCSLWFRWRRAEKFIEENGEVFITTTKAGEKYPIQWPQVGIVNTLAVELRRLEQEFGLTPSARASIQVDVPTDKVTSVIRRDRTA